MHPAWQIEYEIAGAVMHSIASVAYGTQSVSRYWRGCSSLNWFSKPRILVDPAIGPPAVMIQPCVLGCVALCTSCHALNYGLEQERVGSATL